MATILPNDNAPTESVKYLLGNAEFDLAGGGSYDTDDRLVLSAAEAHPWLKVEYPEVDESLFVTESRTVPYEDDVLSAANSVAFDPAEIKKVEEAKRLGYEQPLAVDSGLDQGTPKKSGPVAVTLAADEPVTDDKSATARKGD